MVDVYTSICSRLLLQLKQLLVFLEGFLKDFGVFLWEFAAIHFVDHLWDQAVLNKKAWLTISTPVHTRGVWWGWGQGLWGQVKFFHATFIKPFPYSPCFVHWWTVMLEEKKDLLHNCFWSWKHSVVPNDLIDCPWLDVRRLVQILKNRPIPLSLLHQTSQLAECRHMTFSWHLPNPDSPIWLPNRKVWFVIQQNIFPLLLSPASECIILLPVHLTLGIGLSDVRRAWSCSSMGANFMKPPKHSTFAWAMKSEQCWGLLGTVHPGGLCDFTRSSSSWVSCCSEFLASL